VQDPRTGRWDRTGVVVGVGERRDYLVKMPSGRVWWRNRRFLRAHRPLLPCKAVAHGDRVECPTAERVSPRANRDSDDVGQRVCVEAGHEVDPPTVRVDCEPRRSGRVRHPPDRLVVNPSLKSYE